MGQCQKNTPLSLEKALIDLAIHYEHSLIFNPEIVANKVVNPISHETDIHSALSQLLKNTDLEFSIVRQQVFIFQLRPIYGFVEDLISGERLIGATIYDSVTSSFAITNNQGFFSLKTRSDSASLSVSYIGYDELTLRHQDLNFEKLNQIKLRSNNQFKDVVITDEIRIDHPSLRFLKTGDLLSLDGRQSTSAIGGEGDIMQTVIRQAGITSGADGLGGIHVRGGRTDQNLVLYDGVRIYNPSHTLGIFSVFNSSILSKVKLYKSGSNGSHSGKLSAILDIKTKSPNLTKPKLSLQSSTLMSQINLELPLIKDKLGLLASFRRSHADYWIKENSSDRKKDNNETGETTYFLYDINIKALFKINNNQRVTASFFQGYDSYYDKTAFNQNIAYGVSEVFSGENAFWWKNRLASLNWQMTLGKNWYSELTISQSSYDYNSYNYWYLNYLDFYYYYESQTQEYFTSFNSAITDRSLKLNMQSAVLGINLSYGAQVSQKSYLPGLIDISDILVTNGEFNEVEIEEIISQNIPSEYSAWQYDFHLVGKREIGSQLSLEGALYHTRQKTNDPIYIETTWYSRWYGYLNLDLLLNDKIGVGAKIGRHVQFDHLLSTGDASFPNDIWVPNTSVIGPEQSDQASIYLEWKDQKQNIKLSAFLKRQEGLPLYDAFTSLPSLFELDASFWENEVKIGEAKGYGLELDYIFELNHNIAGHIAYSYQKTEYSSDSINNGKAYPFTYSVPHTLSLGTRIALPRNWSLNLDWYLASGIYYTLYELEYQFSPLNNLDGSGAIPISEINGQQLDTQHKLSFSVAKSWPLRRMTHSLLIGIQNVYNKKNTVFEYQLTGEGLRSQSGFPLFPIFRYTLSI